MFISTLYIVSSMKIHQFVRFYDDFQFPLTLNFHSLLNQNILRDLKSSARRFLGQNCGIFRGATGFLFDEFLQNRNTLKTNNN